MPSFTHSCHGRLVYASGALYFVGGGLAALLGTGPAGTWTFVLTSFIAVVGILVGCVMANETYPLHVLGVILLAPVQAWMTLPAMMLAREKAPGFGWLFIGIGAALLVLPFVVPAGKARPAGTAGAH